MPDLLASWTARADSLRGWNPLLHQRVLAGFNANADLVRRVTPSELDAIVARLPAGTAEAVRSGLAGGRSVEVSLAPSLGAILDGFGPYVQGPGGQAGILREILAGAGGETVELLGESGDPRHYVFEFSGDGGGGRVIFACSAPLVCPDPAVTQAALRAGVDAAFLAGFHRMDRATVRECGRHLLRLRSAGVPVHLELTAMGPESLAAMPALLPFADSVGGSAAEFRQLLGSPDDPAGLIRAMRALLRDNLLARCQAHLDGVQVAVTEASQLEERRGLLLASRAAAEAARTGSLRVGLRDPAPYSLEDIDRFSAVVDELGGDVETGLVGSDAVAAPSAVVPQPRRIVGLGDILSAVGFLARARHLQGRSPDGEADDR